MSTSTFSRRVSEFIGVALFALALIWLIALVTYDASDPVWYFTTATTHAPANFVGPVGAFLSELSFQSFGYAAYLLPALIGVIGWHYFWCQTPDAKYTMLTGVTLLFACMSALLSSVFGPANPADNALEPGGSIGAALAGFLSSYFSRTGSLIVLLSLMMMSVILSTQFSFGRMFAAASSGSRDLSARGVGRFRGWLDDRRKEKARREVVAKHTAKAPAAAPEKPGARGTRIQSVRPPDEELTA